VSDDFSSTTGNMSRRSFIKGASLGAAAISLAAGARGTRVLGANDRLNIGCIGVGGKGSGHVRSLIKRAEDPEQNLRIAGICDVWDRRTEEALDRVGGEAQGFRDYRELLQIPDLDAVVISTPDHWHSMQSIDAMRADLDVYCEKPVTLYWRQAKEVAKVAKKRGTVFQCGAQSCSEGRWWTAQDVIAEGGIGDLVWTQGGYFRNKPTGDWNYTIRDADPKKDLDWDMWLGWKFDRAPRRPFDPERMYRFRKYWDYSGGLATDLIYHIWSHLMVAVGPQFPCNVTGSGANPVHTLENDNREVPTIFHIVSSFPTQHTAHVMATQENKTGTADRIRGQKATLEASGSTLIIRPEEPFREEMMELANSLECYKDAELVTEKKGDKEVLQEIRVSDKYDWGNHMGNWLGCIRTREEPTLNAHRAFQAMVPVALSIMSYREGRVVYFDPEKERVLESKPRSGGGG